MSVLKASWSAFDREIADVYLNGYGHPSLQSKTLMRELLAEMYGDRPFVLADFGCGNGHLGPYFRSEGLDCRYIGYDFSTVLLEAGRAQNDIDPAISFVEADIQDPDLQGERCDVVLFSHVIEMLQSPQKALLAARNLSDLVMIRFFEPPWHAHDATELRMMDVGKGSPPVPYLRRSMSRRAYEGLLAEVGCVRLDVHEVAVDKDEVHLLHFS